MKTYRFSLFLWGLFLLHIAQLPAATRIVITEGTDTTRPIAVIPFKWKQTGAPPQDIATIIADDLRRSGYFNAISNALFPQVPATPREVKKSLWRQLGVEAVIIGEITTSGDDHFELSYHLVHTASLEGNGAIVLDHNRCRVHAHEVRRAAHAISDKIFEKLTGIKGAFNTQIAYVVQVAGAKDFYQLQIAGYDGYHHRTVYSSLEPIMSLAWSPDGQKLAYVTFENHQSQLILHNLSSGKRERLAAFPRHNGAPAFSPDGKRLALVLSKEGSLKIYIMDLASKKLLRVTGGLGHDTEPAWHPDGHSIIFTSDRGGAPEIYQLTLSNQRVQRLTWSGLKNFAGKISSDGKILVMVNRGNGGYNIAKQDFSTGDIKLLTDTFLDETPTIAPNNTMIIYSCSAGSRRVLRLVSMNGHFNAPILTLAPGDQIKFPAWSPAT